MISLKEIVALILMLIAFICILNASVFGNILPTYISYEQLGFQCVSIGTAYICLLYSLSTWIYHSNYSRPRREMRIVLLFMLIILILANFIAFIWYTYALKMSQFEASTDISEIFSSFDVASKVVMVALSIITVVLLFIATLIVAVTLLKKDQETATRRSNKKVVFQ